MTEAWF